MSRMNSKKCKKDFNSPKKHYDLTCEEERIYLSAVQFRCRMQRAREEDERTAIVHVVYDAKNFKQILGDQLPDSIPVGIREIEDDTGNGKGCYNFFPAKEIACVLLKHGINGNTRIFVYGEDVIAAARFAYACLYIGITKIHILDGGIRAWKAEKFPVKKYEADCKKGREELHSFSEGFGFSVPAHPEYLKSCQEIYEKLLSDQDFALISMRSKEEWNGEDSGYSYMEAAGEIRGAVWGRGSDHKDDMSGFFNENYFLRDFSEILRLWEKCSFTLEQEMIFYCGTGWRACVPFLILYQEGCRNMAVYDGGWYEWLQHESFPVQVGDPDREECMFLTVRDIKNKEKSELSAGDETGGLK